MIFSLAPGLKAQPLASEFAGTGRVQVPGFLPDEAALAPYQALRARADWRQVINSGDKVFEFDRRAREALAPDEAARLDAAVHAGARSGFEFRYETLRVDDLERDRADPLDAFTLFLSEGPARDFLRRVTGQAAIAFADAQATAYSPGDFLTGHHDDVVGKDRLAAYVFSLSPGWRVEWGGLLLFHGAGGRVEGFAPRFGCLDLFAVPQLHSVSIVTQAAALRRYSITGWLRAR